MNGERKKKKCWKVFEAESRWINAIHPRGEWKREREKGFLSQMNRRPFQRNQDRLNYGFFSRSLR